MAGTTSSNADHLTPTDPPERIVFFDGVCGLCSHTVDFLMKRDSRGILKFAPLQGIKAADLLPQDIRNQLDTMVYYQNGELYYRSTAVLRIMRDLGGFSGGLGFLVSLIPGPVRDIVYRCVSAWRYRIFGKHETCRIPTAGERARFLD